MSQEKLEKSSADNKFHILNEKGEPVEVIQLPDDVGDEFYIEEISDSERKILPYKKLVKIEGIERGWGEEVAPGKVQQIQEQNIRIGRIDRANKTITFSEEPSGESEKDKRREKYKQLFVFAFFKADGEEGGHEDLLNDATIEEALKRGRELWPDADEFKVSNEQLGDPYSYLFAEDKFESMKRRIAFPEETPTREEFEATRRRLDELNQ